MILSIVQKTIFNLNIIIRRICSYTLFLMICIVSSNNYLRRKIQIKKLKKINEKDRNGEQIFKDGSRRT